MGNVQIEINKAKNYLSKIIKDYEIRHGEDSKVLNQIKTKMLNNNE